ncbi:MAG: hypothetical protein IKS20_10560 [Victivallales bacterium]|nr:hypothetical protein [Victivallales bacterium]
MPDIISYGCGRIIPGAVECEACALPEEKPRLIFIDANMPGALDLLNSAIRKRVAVALRGLDEGNFESIFKFSNASHRNQTPVVVLGSLRYIPAVATIKEIVSTGCLGNEIVINTSTPSGNFQALRVTDIAHWLGAQIMDADLESKLGMALEAKGENGWIKTDFSLDGKKAVFHACIGGHIKERIIPVANPAVSELAILSMSLPPTGRFKALPMMMTI